jgi:hypothetical protein
MFLSDASAAVRPAPSWKDASPVRPEPAGVDVRRSDGLVVCRLQRQPEQYKSVEAQSAASQRDELERPVVLLQPAAGSQCQS